LKTGCFIFTLLICPISHAQVINIPDANFKNALLNHNLVINANGDGEIQVNEAGYVINLEVSGGNISSLEGIEYFMNLLFLNCQSNYVINFDISQNFNHANLLCAHNELISLNISQNINLIELSCSFNNLISLDGSQNSNLLILDCSNNK